VPNDEPVDLGEEARCAYQAGADRYVERAEKNRWNAHWDRPVIRSLLPPTAGKRVLDAGCAGGANGSDSSRKARRSSPSTSRPGWWN
jgi:2-polyprenyl-3-methyl-5-hydroxy-6-metoxy-1,4-benzoquinol methylase